MIKIIYKDLLLYGKLIGTWEFYSDDHNAFKYHVECWANDYGSLYYIHSYINLYNYDNWQELVSIKQNFNEAKDEIKSIYEKELF